MPIAQDSGYLIVMRARRILDLWARLPVARDHPDLIEGLRNATSFVDPAAYRGVGREALEPFPSLDPALLEAFGNAGLDMDSNREARTVFCELLGGDLRSLPNDHEEALLPALEEAREVWRRLDEPADWEVIHVARAPLERSGRTLGYDLGWWGGEFYSLISDCVVAPSWHPPQPEDFEELASQLGQLNEHVLFNSREDALAFKAYYKSKAWAETEDEEGAFAVIRVDAAE